jgi:large subunit ribosomal protein L28
MARRCQLTGKGTQFGHNVSHSNRKTNRRFQPNIQKATLFSDALRRGVPIRVSTRALRSVVRAGGLDAFLLGTADEKLAPEGLRLKRLVKKTLAGTSAKNQPAPAETASA